MKLYILTIAYFLLPASVVFADQLSSEITAETWLGPLFAIVLIAISVLVAKIIKKKN